jgi:hypothetical protein
MKSEFFVEDVRIAIRTGMGAAARGYGVNRRKPLCFE